MPARGGLDLVVGGLLVLVAPAPVLEPARALAHGHGRNSLRGRRPAEPPRVRAARVECPGAMATQGTTVQITMPAMGESVTEGTVLEWLKQVGDTVAVDEPLVEVSTDKVDAEVPSPAAGVLAKILVEADETVQVGPGARRDRGRRRARRRDDPPRRPTAPVRRSTPPRGDGGGAARSWT